MLFPSLVPQSHMAPGGAQGLQDNISQSLQGSATAPVMPFSEMKIDKHGIRAWQIFLNLSPFGLQSEYDSKKCLRSTHTYKNTST